MSDSPEKIIESAREDILNLGRRIVQDRLGPESGAIAKETGRRLAMHFDKLLGTAAPLLAVSKAAGGNSQIVYGMAMEMLEASMEIAVAALAEGLDAARYTRPVGTIN